MHPVLSFVLSVPLIIAGAIGEPDECAWVAPVKPEDCLTEARRRILEADDAFGIIEAALDGDHGSRDTLESLRGEPVHVFRSFEGIWEGHWRALAVRHAWISVDARAQLVVVEDAGDKQRGINLVGADGQICGIVVESGGRERLHIGDVIGAEDGTSQLRWQSGDHTYYERVVPALNGTREYEIVEMLTDGELMRLGVVARYQSVGAEGT